MKFENFEKQNIIQKPEKQEINESEKFDNPKEELETQDSLLEKGVKEKTIEIPEIGEDIREYQMASERSRKREAVLRAFTDDKFPTETFNHKFGEIHGKVTEPEKFFKQDKLLLQKLFNFKEKEYEISSHQFYFMDVKKNKLTPVSEIIDNFPKHEKGSCLLMDKNKNLHLGYLSNSPEDKKYKAMRMMGIVEQNCLSFSFDSECIHKIKKQLFSKKFCGMTGPRTGLSVSNKGNVWEGIDDLKNNMLFGFGEKNKVFKKYLKNVFTLYEDNLLPKIHEFESRSLKNEIRLEYVEKNKYRGIDPSQITEREKNEFKIRKDEFEKYHNYIAGSLYTLETSNKYSYGTIHNNEYYDHPRIPIVLNHPNIPELRWCHADYASIPTKKGWNIIEMVT